MAVVYVVQKQYTRDPKTGEQVDRFDMVDAEKFGEVKYLLNPRATPYRVGAIITELYAKLDTFSDEDHLLLVGNQCLAGLAMSVASDVNNGRVSILQWSGRDQTYIKIEADINE